MPLGPVEPVNKDKETVLVKYFDTNTKTQTVRRRLILPLDMAIGGGQMPTSPTSYSNVRGFNAPSPTPTQSSMASSTGRMTILSCSGTGDAVNMTTTTRTQFQDPHGGIDRCGSTTPTHGRRSMNVSNWVSPSGGARAGAAFMRDAKMMAAPAMYHRKSCAAWF
ncbi:unnamed protein product [Pedinophyceae sp. YPF-701]|nr:unnamed protein product [Pedinophyceae sp. YPF-701]